MHVVDRLLQAYNAKDIDAFLSCCSPDVIAENFVRHVCPPTTEIDRHRQE